MPDPERETECAVKSAEQRLTWINEARNLELSCKNPMNVCLRCMDLPSTGKFCRWCLAEMWHRTSGSWRHAPGDPPPNG